MKTLFKLLFCVTLLITISSCENQVSESHLALENVAAQVEANIKLYENVWDKAINDGQIELVNEDSFTTDATVVIPGENIVGIENFRAYYNNYIVGFSEREFTIVKVFGQNDNLVKQWRFKGKHTGDFFCILATDKSVDLSGVTIVEMRDGKIASEQDFFDNLDFLKQLGLME